MVPAAGSALPERSGGGAGSLRGISAEHGRAATRLDAFRVPAVGNKYSIDFRSSEIPVFCQGIGQVLLRIFMGVQREGCSEKVCAARIFLRAGEKGEARGKAGARPCGGAVRKPSAGASAASVPRNRGEDPARFRSPALWSATAGACGPCLTSAGPLVCR